MVITVPDGVFAGNKLKVVTPEGAKVLITVPDGAKPGSVIALRLSSQEMEQSQSLSLDNADMPSSPRG